VANADQADSNGNGIGDACEESAAPQPVTGTAACCAPGTSQMVGMITPVVMLGWKMRRRRK